VAEVSSATSPVQTAPWLTVRVGHRGVELSAKVRVWPMGLGLRSDSRLRPGSVKSQESSRHSLLQPV
jgi:hypothetical protein